jgi:hypothetical protein
VHGEFFDALFSINDKIFVDALGRRITSQEGNWINWEVCKRWDGNYLIPVYIDTLCNCKWDAFNSCWIYKEGGK